VAKRNRADIDGPGESGTTDLFFDFANQATGMVLFHSVRALVNWRAFGTTILWVLLTSLLWQATLASPYGWWRYNDRWMMGLNVNDWADLPIEAVSWCLVVTFTTVLVHEAIRLALRRRDSA
jgi:hypothetical protein